MTKRSVAAAAITLCLLPPALAEEIGTKGDKASCEELDLRAIRLGGQRRLEEAAKVMDYAIAKCAADPSRLTSRGVLYAVMGDKGSAERLISEAIQLSETRGDKCGADLSRGQLAAIKGEIVPTSPPSTCRQRRKGA